MGKLATLASALAVWAVVSVSNEGVRFQDVGKQAGVNATIISGGLKKNYVLEVNGSGACWFDYDQDGFPDLYLVNGATVAQLQSKEARRSTNHLYRNRGDGTFEDVTGKAGVAGRGWGFGCVAADYDNDGRPDLFVSNFGPNILYRNRSDGTFDDVTTRAGVAGGEIWHAGAAFGDYDNDGALDLFVPGYLDFDVRRPELKTCEWRGVKVNACGPMGYKGAPDALYRNNGNGTFTEVTAKAGVADRTLYFGFQAVFEDFDDDGRPDLFVANDSNPNYLYRNRGDGTFEEIGVAAGVAYTANGKEMSSMGVAVGDYDNDGRMDIFVTTFANDNYVLFHNEGDGTFSDVSYPSGLGEPTIPYLGWATCFLDYDNDGLKDLFAANGHVYPEVDGRIAETYAQPPQLFRNTGESRFVEVSEAIGLNRLPLRSARGGACADFDNDGDVDVLISNIDERPFLLRNEGGNRNHWLGIRLVGARKNRDAIGAKVTVAAGGRTQQDRIRAGGSYLSANDIRLHFGLGSANKADRIEIVWPGGSVQRLENVPANQFLKISEK